jgi:omega-6 fatty acid desaturase (delta-12 desaturase)
MGYVARDLCLVGILGYAASNIHYLPSFYVRLLAWTAYAIIQGIFGTGVWILAHECGHGAFSKLKWLNNIMGMIMHSMLLVPFHSWRLSHRQHHKATGNLQRDVVFIPRSRQSWIQKRYGKSADPAELRFESIVEDAPLTIAWNLLVHQLLGWPLYMFLNITGQNYEGSILKKNHFYFGNDSPLFREEDSNEVLISDIGIFVALSMMYLVIMRFGFWNWFLFYGAPYLWVNNWIGMKLWHLLHRLSADHIRSQF